MKRKILSAVLIFSILCGVMPSVSARKNESDKDLDSIRVEMAEEANVEGMDLGQLSVPYDFDPEATQEPVSNEPIVHEDTFSEEINFGEEGEELGMVATEFEEKGGAAVFVASSTSNSNLELWDSLCKRAFGDSYLSPYDTKNVKREISGDTNRLVVEATDLSLQGKNGLDVNIVRRSDNQYSKSVYAPSTTYNKVTADRKAYGFLNETTGTRLYVLFACDDDFLAFMKRGLTVSELPSSARGTHTYNGKKVNYYLFEDIYQYKDDIGNVLTYDSNMGTFKDEEELHKNIELAGHRLLPNNNDLGYGWEIMLPEAYLNRYYHSSDKSSSYIGYTDEYNGSFRDINGNVYMIEGTTTYKHYANGDSRNSLLSNFYSDKNKYLKYEAFLYPQTIEGETYNFVVSDNRGLKYYFKNTGIEPDSINSKQNMYIVALQDNYGNTIRYKYNLDGGPVTKIIDTYGREINISYSSSVTTISYYEPDSGVNKTITYNKETLSPSALMNDSLLKDKDVLRFTVTNEAGETTIYDQRESKHVTYYRAVNGFGDINLPQTGMAMPIETSTEYNIERIQYPTGAENRYRYTRLYPRRQGQKMVTCISAVDNSYNLDGSNHISENNYSFSNWEYDITVNAETVNGAKTKTHYNSDGLKTSSYISATGSVASKPYINTSYSYDKNNNITKQDVNNSGLRNITNWEYLEGYPGAVTSMTTDKEKVTYTYNSLNSNYTAVPKVTTYKYKEGSKYVDDYSIETTINSNGYPEIIKQIKDNNIKSQTKYVYDAFGRTISTLRWTSDSNSDGTLDENDKYEKHDNNYAEVSGTVNVGISVNDLKDADNNDADSINELYKYNIYGYPKEREDSYREVTYITYDEAVRPVKYTYANGAERNIQYNTAQNYTIVTDETGTQFKYIYDRFGKLTHKYFFEDGIWKPTIRYSYDSLGRVSYYDKFSEPGKYIREIYSYDVCDRVIEKKVYDKDSVYLYTENYEYAVKNDQLKVIKTTTTADNSSKASETEYYDKYGRLVKKEIADGSTVMTNEYTYDYKDNVLTETDAKGNVTTYEYDMNNQMTKKTLPDGHYYMWTYDMLGRIGVSFDSAPFAFTTYWYDALGREIKRREPAEPVSRLVKQYYDANSNVIKIMSQNNAGNDAETFAETNYTYDNMYNQTVDKI